MASPCAHVDRTIDVHPRSTGCEECLRTGDVWVHLRMCMACGHIGCCDNSKNRHARGHHRTAGHPLIQSYEPGEEWWWCFVDDVGFYVADAPSYAHP